MASDDRSSQSEDGGGRVHHTSPLAKLGLLFRVRAKDVGNRRRRQSNDSARESTEGDDEGDSGVGTVGERPQEESEQGSDECDKAVDVESAELVGGGTCADAANGRRRIHDGEEPVCRNRTLGWLLWQAHVLSDVVGLTVAETAVDGPFFQVKEDGVKAEEQEADGSDEPQEGTVLLEGVLVPEDVDVEPGLRLANDVGWIGTSDDDCESGCDAGDSGHIAGSIVEAVGFDQVADHDRVDETGNGST